MVRRREILKTAIVLAAGQLPYADLVQAAAAAPTRAPGPQSAAAAGSGPAKPFDYAWLKGQARFLASNPYETSKDVMPPAWRARTTTNINRCGFAPITRCGQMRTCPSACSSSTLGEASRKPCTSTR